VRIYQAEKDAGINFQMNNSGSSSAFVTAKVQVRDIAKYFDGMSVADLMKSINTVQTVKELLGQEQPDLALVVAILVSTGWNLNDDIFTPAEVWKARNTPLHKPMNDNHQAAKILGHIVQTRVLDKFGAEIDIAENDTPPDEFDVEVAGVLYRAFPELAERIDEIITKAKAGEMFVSMEAWFPDFGYGLILPGTQETKLIDRNEQTAFLTKHLRIYGGSGQYQGYQVGRVLKDIIFGAQGFVEDPANPESVIKVAANKVVAPQICVRAELNELLEGGVEDVTEQEMKELQAKLEESQADINDKVSVIAELTKTVEDFKGQVGVLDGKVEKLTASLTETSDKMGVAEAAKVELQKQLDEAVVRTEKSEAELDEIRKNESARNRMAQLAAVKTIDDEAATLAELRNMTDETFEVVLKYAGETTKNKSVQDTNTADNDGQTAKVDAEDQALAALATAKVDDTADFSATDDGVDSEKDGWQSTAFALCRRIEEKE